MAKNDHLDLLIAELLGDVGELNNAIKVLKDDTLPALVNDAEEKLSGTVGKLLMAAQHFDKAVKEHIQKRVDTAEAEIAASAVKAKNDALVSIRQEIREVIAHPIGQLVNQLNNAVDKANDEQGRTLKHAIIASVIGGIVAGAIVLGGGYLLMKDAGSAAVPQSEEGMPTKLIKKESK